MSSITSPANSTPLDAHPIFSFANGEMGPLASGFIRAMEKVTGQPKIKKLYFDYVEDERPREMFWTDALKRLNISYQVKRERGANIPKTGPALAIANHPFGVIDGLVLCAMMSEIRQDYRIITHQVLRQAPAVMDKILPIDFAETETVMSLPSLIDVEFMVNKDISFVIFLASSRQVAGLAPESLPFEYKCGV